MENRVRFPRWTGLLIMATGLATAGCGNTLDCIIRGDNVKGRIVFGPGAPARARANTIVETSTDGFATSGDSGTSEHNLHGFISFDYSLCAPNDADFSVRAYQDENGNGTWDPGEANGRDDGTSDGHGAYRTYRLAAPIETEDDAGVWNVQRGVDITMDSKGAR